MDDNLADDIRRACCDAAKQAFEEAGLRGLCTEGRIEYALDAIRSVPIEQILQDHLEEPSQIPRK